MSHDTPPRPSRAARTQGPAAVAAGLTAFEGLVLLGFAFFYVYEIVAGAADNAVQGATQGALILVFALGLLALARGWVRGADWPRTPTLLWNALLLPVAWSLFQSDRVLIALGIALLAVLSIGAALAARPADPMGPVGSGGRGRDGQDESDRVS